MELLKLVLESLGLVHSGQLISAIPRSQLTRQAGIDHEGKLTLLSTKHS